MHTLQILEEDYTLATCDIEKCSVAFIEEQIDLGFVVMFDDIVIEQADGITGEVKVMGEWVQYSDLLSK